MQLPADVSAHAIAAASSCLPEASTMSLSGCVATHAQHSPASAWHPSNDPAPSLCSSSQPCAQPPRPPRRFFAESAATMGCMVFGVRSRPSGQDYWITDGLYGSFNCLLYDHATLAPVPLLRAQILGDTPPTPQESLRGLLSPATVFGPTCDGADQILQAYPLPELQRGDWLVFPNMGAYTLVGACKFNGIDVVDVAKAYIWSCRP